MRVILLFIVIFFVGCTQKNVNIYAVVKPNSITSNKIKNIKIDKIKNDKTNLKAQITTKLLEVNSLIPNYFHINDENYTSILKGKETLKISDKFYTKKVLIDYEKPRCKVFLYPCKNIDNMTFCKTTPIIYSTKYFDKIKKKSYQNNQYILINNQIYKKTTKCKPKFANIKCEKKEINLYVTLNITNKNNSPIFSKTYHHLTIDDPCEDIDEIYPDSDRIYKSDLNLENEKYRLSNLIASEFIQDIAPHYTIFNAPIFEDLDIKISYKDKKEFKNIIDKLSNNNSYLFISQMKSLLQKYPKSCVIKYDLAVMYMQIKNFSKAKNLLLNLNCKNDEINENRNILLYNLNKIYK